MTIELDVHTHTIMSGHGYSTIREMARGAADKGLKLLGITEHAPGIPGTCAPIYFENLRVVPRSMYGVELLLGAEINILDYEGKLSLEDHIIDKLDLRIAGIHRQCYIPGTIEQNTNAVLGAMKNPKIDIISHPDDGSCPLDYDRIVQASKQYGTLLEVNNNSLNPVNGRKQVRENNIQLLHLCKKHQVPIIIASDAHVDADIGRCDFAKTVLAEVDFPKDLVINTSVTSFKSRIKENRKRVMVAAV